MKTLPCLHVAVGVIKNAHNQILIARRHASVHQGGLWEFPGGKVQPGESVLVALTRELKEELDITITASLPLIQIRHQYPDLNVFLDVRMVYSFVGEARANEGQPIAWVSVAELGDYAFPAANAAIITATCLAHRYAIIEGDSVAELMQRLRVLVNQGVTLLQLRQKTLSKLQLQDFLCHATALCKTRGVDLLVNSSVANAMDLANISLHLTGHDLKNWQKRPDGLKYLAASCHHLEQCLHAQAMGVDFVVLSPVCPTKTHPEADSLGWQQFAEIVVQLNIPVFALGGMTEADELIARKMGGQGIAGIRMFKTNNESD